MDAPGTVRLAVLINASALPAATMAAAAKPAINILFIELSWVCATARRVGVPCQDASGAHWFLPPFPRDTGVGISRMGIGNASPGDDRSMVENMNTTDRKTAALPKPGGISAVVSDVDGTLVADDKSLPQSNRLAVAKLADAGIAFALISSRPPRGMAEVIEALAVPLIFAGFNGGVISTTKGEILEQHLLAPDLARRTVESLTADGVDVWVFSGQEWFVQNADSHYVAHETHTVGFRPTLVRDFGAALETVGKIVGVSADPALLGRSEVKLRAGLSDEATIVRSQRYYLDITHPLANKGAGVRSIAKQLGVSLDEVAVIGDGPNDVVMFEAGGLSIAMGNAEPAVQQAANFVTGPNNDGGFAQAMERFVLGAH